MKAVGAHSLTRTLAALTVLFWIESGRSAEPSMAPVPAGVFTPLFNDSRPKGASPEPVKDIPVDAFTIDVHAVTNADYLKFVKANPKWSRSRIKRTFAESSYLKHWKSDFEIGPGQTSAAPVVNVSWFAARAYCKSLGKRLPSVVEWERAASIDPDPGAEEDHRKRLMEWYSKPTPRKLPPVPVTPRNRFGIHDLHGVVWEWTEDFNSSIVMGDSRGDEGGDKSTFCGGGVASSRDFRDYAGFMRYAFRSSLRGDYTTANLGFRCAR